VYDELVYAAMKSNGDFTLALKSVMKRRGITSKELSKGANLPLSTINKVISQDRDIRLSTFRNLLKYIHSLEKPVEGDMVIGIIAARPSLDTFAKHVISVKGKKVTIKEYPAVDIEGAIIGAIKAEREKVDGIVCASIVASIIEKFVRIPIMAIRVDESNIADSIAVLVEKIPPKAE
jgi:predicted transcriptional regulator